MANLTGSKSLFLSKTNITGLLIALLGVLGLLGVLPADLDAPALVQTLITAGGALVILFRSIATQRVGSSTPTV
jgi:hypothetical protein